MSIQSSQARQEEVKARLEDLIAILRASSAFEGDTASWAASAICSYLSGAATSLDIAFDIKKDGRSSKALTKHDEWAPHAWLDLEHALIANHGKETQTSTQARIGRYYGLGGSDSENQTDSAVASELLRILGRYKQVIANHWGLVLTNRLNDKDANIGN